MTSDQHEQTFDIVPQSAADETAEIARDDNGRVGSDGARSLANMRWAKHYDAIERGAGKAVGGTSVDAVEKMATVTTKRAIDGDDKKQLQAAHLMMDKLMGEHTPQVDNPDAVTITATIPLDAIPDIALALAEARRMRENPPD